ncbi:Twinkle-like [Homarus americanus]|uniref:Twinkle-like n=1 Tax=Homarus americanus TaxID=6706 RepID=A0A8J5JLU4_HOMAM|nr:Twinkle-like [Homarus americanus]
MLLLKAVSRTCIISRHCLSYQKVSTLTQQLRHFHRQCASIHPRRRVMARTIYTQHSDQATKASSKIIPDSYGVSLHRFISSSAPQRLQSPFLLANVLQNRSEQRASKDKNNTGVSSYFCNLSQVRNVILSQVRNVYTSLPRKDIPEYLHGNISEVASIEKDLFEDELENDLYNDTIEDDIVDFFTSHLISYEETDTSFTLQCPTCFSKECDTNVPAQEIFVDKNSGYFVCPWCNQDGSWEELMHLLNSQEDCLTTEQLNSYLATTLPITDVGEHFLQDSPLKNVSTRTLEKFGARLTNDETRLVVPIYTVDGEVIIRRCVAGELKAFSLVSMSKKQKKVIVVPTCCDVLVLAEYNIAAVSLPSANFEALEEYLLSYGKNEVLLWYRGEAPPRPLLMSLIKAGVSCSLVQSSGNDYPIHKKSLEEVKTCLKDTIPIVCETIVTFQQLKDKIYHRLTHQEETCGVQWKRFSELNALLLGHRQGEMTVLTGPTGSGKTTFMAEYSLDLCSQGVKTLWGSFEVSIVRLCEVMLQQFSGAPLPHDLTTFNTLASQFSILPLHFLTYHGQQTPASVIKALTEAVQVWGIQHVIIDNLQFMLGTSEQGLDRWWEQDKAVTAFRRFATLNNCHITLVVHPKKVPQGQPLSIESVFGGAKVTQEADNVLILQVKEGFTISQSKKTLQVVKNRYGGQLGEMPLKFHKDSLTLSSCFRQKSKHKTPTEAAEQRTSKVSSMRRLRIKGISGFQN